MRPTQRCPYKGASLLTFTPTVDRLIAEFDAAPCEDLDRLRAKQIGTDDENWLVKALDRWQDRRFMNLTEWER